MPIVLRKNESPKYVEAFFSGWITPAELTQQAEETLAGARSHGTHLILADCRGLTGGHSIADLYGVAIWLSQDRAGPRVKEAVLAPRMDSAKVSPRIGRRCVSTEA